MRGAGRHHDDGGAPERTPHGQGHVQPGRGKVLAPHPAGRGHRRHRHQVSPQPRCPVPESLRAAQAAEVTEWGLQPGQAIEAARWCTCGRLHGDRPWASCVPCLVCVRTGCRPLAAPTAGPVGPVQPGGAGITISWPRPSTSSRTTGFLVPVPCRAKPTSSSQSFLVWGQGLPAPSIQAPICPLFSASVPGHRRHQDDAQWDAAALGGLFPHMLQEAISCMLPGRAEPSSSSHVCLLWGRAPSIQAPICPPS